VIKGTAAGLLAGLPLGPSSSRLLEADADFVEEQ